MRNFLSILWHFAGLASSLIGSQSSLPNDCEKAQSFFLDSSNKDMPESGSGSHAEPILKTPETLMQKGVHLVMGWRQ